MYQYEIIESVFLELLGCDPTKPDKTNLATARKLTDFISGKLQLDMYHDKINFASDHAISNSICKAMEKMDVYDLENKWRCCGTHTGNNVYKREKSNKEKRMLFNDTKGESIFEF